MGVAHTIVFFFWFFFSLSGEFYFFMISSFFIGVSVNFVVPEGSGTRLCRGATCQEYRRLSEHYFFACCIFRVSFILKDFPFMLTK